MPDLARWFRLRPAAKPHAARITEDKLRDPAGRPEPVTRRVLMVTHQPALRGGVTLREHFGWNDPDALARQYIDDVRECSYGYANYELAERVVVDAFPLKIDGFAYDGRSYLEAWRSGKFHQPDGVDYLRLAEQFDVLEKVRNGTIDEVWLFGFPYAGYYESIMAGPGAFWCNAPPLSGAEGAGRRFVIMGFNYERGVGEMLEDLGHRVESMMGRVFEGRRGDANLWERFTRYDRTHPGRSECGNVHFAPNSLADYDWGNRRTVLSRAHTWHNFPDLDGQPHPVDCREWGSGDIRLHHRWWLQHLPHVAGSADGISWNWWEYIVDPNVVR